MLRVLQCVVGLNPGGIETLLMNLYRHIDRDRVQFDFLISKTGSLEEPIKALGGRVYQVPFISQTGPFIYSAQLRRFFRAHPEYKIIHVHMDKFGGMVVREAEKAGVPARIIHCHNTKNEGGFIYQTVKNYYGRYATRCATSLYACSKDAAAWMYGPRAGDAIILNNGVDLELFTNEDLRDPAHFTVGHVGRFVPAKNHAFLVEIFAAVMKLEPNARLVLVGDGDGRPETQRLVAEKGLSGNVQFLGLRSDINLLLRGFDVLCMPSLHEGLPVSMVEAQASGVPCLVADTVSKESNITGNVEFMGLDRPPAEWAEHLLAYKGRLRADNHRKLIGADYSIAYSAKKLEEFYLETAGLL